MVDDGYSIGRKPASDSIAIVSLILGDHDNPTWNRIENEFGHPEWIDFPREGNGNSYAHCRRQWNLMYDDLLRYGQLYQWDEAMNHTEILFGSMIKPH